MQVRRAQPSDIPDLIRLNETVQELHHEAEPHLYGPHQADHVEDFLREWIGSEGKETWIAYRDSHCLGYLTFVVLRRAATPFSPERADLYVDALGVAPEAQRQGVGRALMRHAESRARELGLNRVRLDVRNANPNGIRFYEALGYSPEQTKMSIEVDRP